jgi:hypothetical protein
MHELYFIALGDLLDGFVLTVLIAVAIARSITPSAL